MQLLCWIEEQHIMDPITDADLKRVFGLFESNTSMDPAFALSSLMRTVRSPAAARAVTASPHTVPAYSLRYVLAGIQTSDGTQLVDEEVDTLFRDLGIKTERDRVDYVAAMQVLAGGYMSVL